jgi:hypothetical protein
MTAIINYPSIEQVRRADHEQLGKWYRFLRSPANDTEQTVMSLIVTRFNKKGGFNPELSKKIGQGDK